MGRLQYVREKSGDKTGTDYPKKMGALSQALGKQVRKRTEDRKRKGKKDSRGGKQKLPDWGGEITKGQNIRGEDLGDSGGKKKKRGKGAQEKGGGFGQKLSRPEVPLKIA